MSPAEMHATLARLRAAQQATTPDYAWRKHKLEALRSAVKARLDDIVAAVNADFGRRSRHETLLSDGMTVLNDIDYTLRHLRRWMRPRWAPVDWTFWPARAEIRPQPLGVVGIISPWNYPVNLALMPLVAAVAAGNFVMLKPSELTPATSELLRSLLAEVFSADECAVVLGGPEVAGAFAALPFDHLFFTGSTAVGRKVMAAAAANLTPVTLELGGKSPAIVAPGFPLQLAAQRIAAGKLINAGQTCIAPDYVLLPRGSEAAFVEALRAYVREAYPDLSESPDYTAIVSARHYGRLKQLLDEARSRGAQVIPLAEETPAAAQKRIFAPTVVQDAPADCRLMQEEIFGPVLPILGYEEIDQAIAHVNAGDRPLALYHFDRDRRRTERVLEQTLSGGVTVNDTVVHIAQSALPFGGVGPSGMGAYHGEAGFRTFSKDKPVLYQARWSSFWLFKPPYRRLADRLVAFLTR